MGVWVAAGAVVVAVLFGLYRRRVDGRFRRVPSDLVDTAPPALAVPEPEHPARTWHGYELGERATLIQFSSAFCAPCRTTRVVLDDVAATEAGVVHHDVDAEAELALVRELNILRTPTTLILDAAGQEVARAAGAPRKEQVLGVLPRA